MQQVDHTGDRDPLTPNRQREVRRLLRDKLPVEFLNLQKARSMDSAIQQVVIVSTPAQIENFQEEIEAVGGEFGKAVSYMEPGDVKEANTLLSDLQQILQDADLLGTF